MKRGIFALFAALLIFSSSALQAKQLEVVVSNKSKLARTNETVELDASAVRAKLGVNGISSMVVKDDAGKELASQVTYDGKLIFQVSLDAKESAQFVVTVGAPHVSKPKVFGKQYPQRVDDFAWENDRIAFRTYGPALQATGERAFGFDVWTKSTPELVVDMRYELELGAKTKATAAKLRKTNPKAVGSFLRSTSYHVDHGNGMDFYNVGPTLGAGTPALMENGNIVYPYCYKECEILDNGPLRLTFKLTYTPTTINGQNDVIESRIVSIDAGSQMNKTTVSFKNLADKTPIMVGLVMREAEGKALYNANKKDGYATYATSPEVASAKSNGVIYVGSVFTEPVKDAKAIYFSAEESKKERAGALGHTALISSYKPNSEFVYYWGAGWSKYGFDSYQAWDDYVNQYSQKIKSPLKVKY